MGPRATNPGAPSFGFSSRHVNQAAPPLAPFVHDRRVPHAAERVGSRLAEALGYAPPRTKDLRETPPDSGRPEVRSALITPPTCGEQDRTAQSLDTKKHLGGPFGTACEVSNYCDLR